MPLSVGFHSAEINHWGQAKEALRFLSLISFFPNINNNVKIKIYLISFYLFNTGTVTQLLFACKKFMRGSLEPCCREYFTLRTIQCPFFFFCSYMGFDKAWSPKLFVASSLISIKSQNKVVEKNTKQWLVIH